MSQSNPDKTVLSEAELDKVRSLKDERDRLYYQIGFLEYQIKLLQDNIKETQDMKQKFYDKLQELNLKSKKIGKELTKRYGSQEIDLETGVVGGDAS